MRCARIIVTYENIKKLLGLPAEVEIQNVVRVDTDLYANTFSVFIIGDNLMEVPEGTEIPWLVIDSVKERYK